MPFKVANGVNRLRWLRHYLTKIMDQDKIYPLPRAEYKNLFKFKGCRVKLKSLNSELEKLN